MRTEDKIATFEDSSAHLQQPEREKSDEQSTSSSWYQVMALVPVMDATMRVVGWFGQKGLAYKTDELAGRHKCRRPA